MLDRKNRALTSTRNRAPDRGVLQGSDDGTNGSVLESIWR